MLSAEYLPFIKPAWSGLINLGKMSSNLFASSLVIIL